MWVAAEWGDLGCTCMDGLAQLVSVLPVFFLPRVQSPLLSYFGFSFFFTSPSRHYLPNYPGVLDPISQVLIWTNLSTVPVKHLHFLGFLDSRPIFWVYHLISITFS